MLGWVGVNPPAKLAAVGDDGTGPPGPDLTLNHPDRGVIPGAVGLPLGGRRSWRGSCRSPGKPRRPPGWVRGSAPHNPDSAACGPAATGWRCPPGACTAHTAPPAARVPADRGRRHGRLAHGRVVIQRQDEPAGGAGGVLVAEPNHLRVASPTTAWQVDDGPSIGSHPKGSPTASSGCAREAAQVGGVWP
jgi:hypothetical protein